MESDPDEQVVWKWFRKGTKALQEEKLQYAASCFGTCVRMKPDNVLYRQVLRGVIDRIDGDLPGG